MFWSGVPRGGLWTGLFALYVFATWHDVCRDVGARHPYHRVTYHQQLTLPASGRMSSQSSSLNRLVWLALRAAGTHAACACKIHLLEMVPSRSGLEWAWAWLLRSERTALSYSLGVPGLPPVGH